MYRKLALLSAITLPAFAGFIIPSAEWGTGIGTVYDNIANYQGPFTCSLSASVNTCTQSIASNLPPDSSNSPNGTANGTASAYTDSKGAHLYLESGVSGQADTDVTGRASIYDTVYNNTGTVAKVQFTFHLDATLYSVSTASSFLSLDFNNQNIFQAQVANGGAGTYDFVNQNFTTPLLTVGANSYVNWSLVLSGEEVVSSNAATTYLAGYPTGFVGAANTLSFTGIAVSDAAGNPISNSGLTSYAGFDYSTSSTSASTAAPEPATLVLTAASAGLLLLLRPRRKGAFLHPHPRTLHCDRHFTADSSPRIA
jgi:hypothetical protein